MTAAAPATAAQPTTAPARGKLTFGGILHSEWIKFVSLTSTITTLIAIVVAIVGIGAIIASSARSWIEQSPGGATDFLAASAATGGISLAQLIVVVLGTLTVTREYGTGMIRATFTAAPRRLTVLAAKVVVFAVSVFVLGFVAIFATALLAQAIVGDAAAVGLGDGETWRMLVGGAGYLTLSGLLGLGLGALLRNTAGGIFGAIALLLVLPIVLSLIDADWARNATSFLPMNAGATLYSPATDLTGIPQEALDQMPPQLDPLQGLLVLLGWLAAVFVPAAVLLRRRDA
ncbi:ABC transporter permease subunit [Agromyces seonyuensis]|uniref:ABC transporter permease subunit n=1 Tax=Agromyces seonyuensis TaxID=2662446 RepID=A0A6I4P2E4_9MICO|nr:ABC transporter permease subunit [Agromyces seonyuensis]MWB97364.1 ABC transporter permease subunit [Agromyces seonyuensis]